MPVKALGRPDIDLRGIWKELKKGKFTHVRYRFSLVKA
jgi:hypothetical protein